VSIQQDFYAKIVASNLTALMEIDAQKKVDKRTHDLELNYQVNSAQALSKMKHRLVTFILDAHKDIMLTQQICLKSSQFLPTVLGVYNFLQCPSEDNITP
jgi:hypothetical protein